jgi:glycosyltransferase involved in cell wall biosynthesis
MARALARDLSVTLAAPEPLEPGEIDGLKMTSYSPGKPEELKTLAEQSEVILASLNLLERFPFLTQSEARLVVDFYDPFLLENLHYYDEQPLDTQLDYNRAAVAITNRLAQSGDFYICGSERQRDFWLGVLAANGRVNPHTYSQDPTLRRLIDVVGVGFPSRPPHAGPYLKGRHPAVPEDARLVLWGGGVWNWLDPLTLLQAWPDVLADQPQARLVFLGTRHPNPDVPRHRMAARAEALAAEIGEKDRTVLFIEWVPYQEREALLSEADLGVSLHPIHVETRYALRTRVLDYFWARLPVLLTEGDVASEWVQEYGLGQVVPPYGAKAVAGAIKTLLAQDRSSWKERYEPLQEVFRWDKVIAPLLDYCLHGPAAPDRKIAKLQTAGLPTTDSGVSPIRRGLSIWRTEGIRVALHRGWRYLQWRLSR